MGDEVELNEKADAKKNLLPRIVIAACIVAAVAFAAGFFGGQLAKKIFPQFFAAQALSASMREVAPQIGNWFSAWQEIKKGAWERDLTVGLSAIDAEGIELDPMIMIAARMFSFKNTTRFDPSAEAYDNKLILQMAMTQLFELNGYFDRGRISLGFPQGMDYRVTVDPRAFVSEWDASLLGGELPLGRYTGDERIYQSYIDLLFGRAKEADTEIEFDESVLSEITYGYEGKQKTVLNGTELNCDVYSVTVSKAALNKFAENLIRNSRFSEILVVFPEDLIILLYAANGKLACAEFEIRSEIGSETENGGYIDSMIINGKIISDTELRIQLDAIAEESENRQSVYLSLDALLTPEEEQLRGEKILFEGSVAVNEQGNNRNSVFTWRADGRLRSNVENKRVEADFGELSFSFSLNGTRLADVEFDVKYMLRAGSDPVLRPYGNERGLSELQAMDLFEIMARLESDPQLRRLFEMAE